MAAPADRPAEAEGIDCFVTPATPGGLTGAETGISDEARVEMLSSPYPGPVVNQALRDTVRLPSDRANKKNNPRRKLSKTVSGGFHCFFLRHAAAHIENANKAKSKRKKGVVSELRFGFVIG